VSFVIMVYRVDEEALAPGLVRTDRQLSKARELVSKLAASITQKFPNDEVFFLYDVDDAAVSSVIAEFEDLGRRQ